MKELDRCVFPVLTASVPIMKKIFKAMMRLFSDLRRITEI